MTARWEKLPTDARPAARRSRARRGCWRCGGANGCGDTLVDVTYAAAERHADLHGGARLECVVPNGET